MNVLYLSYTGLAEPLGQSQILAYLRGLAADHRITLVSFEKPAALADSAGMAALRDCCAEHGIRWVPRRYHHRPRLPATAWDVAVFTWTALRQARNGDADLVHARGYIPAFVALVLKGALGLPFVFDMRALWPEEMVAAGRLKRHSAMFRLITWAERLCLRHADAVVSLTHAAVEQVKRRRGGDLSRARIAVIPTCVDLDRFRWDRANGTGGAPLVIGSVGTVLSGWFRLDWLMEFFRASTETWPDVTFRIVTRDERAPIVAAAERAGIDGGRLEIEARTPGEMPQALAKLDAVAMFFEPGPAKLASCPTRMGEVLASGLPVIANGGVGDVAEIIRSFDVGVIVGDATERSMREAAADLARLLDDPGLAGRCRMAAETWFSLKTGTAAYHALYQEIAGTEGALQPQPSRSVS